MIESSTLVLRGLPGLKSLLDVLGKMIGSRSNELSTLTVSFDQRMMSRSFGDRRHSSKTRVNSAVISSALSNVAQRTASAAYLVVSFAAFLAVSATSYSSCATRSALLRVVWALARALAREMPAFTAST